MNSLYELSLYVMLEGAEPEIIDVLLTDEKDRCLMMAQKCQDKLGPKQYLELFNDETQETIYILKDGTLLTKFKDLIKSL